jgi:hypothetical protein
MLRLFFFLPVALLILSSCSKSSGCDSNQATNKMLALGKVQSRLVSKGGDAGAKLALTLAQESAPVGELIGKEKFLEACELADSLATKYKLDLTAEQKDMLTIEELQKDGGKGSGACSITDAANRQMEVHAALQAQVDAGTKSSEVFQQFNKDTISFGELIATDPSKACALLDDLKKKYEL